MTQGFTSNYNDSGYTINGTFFDTSGILQSDLNVASSDIYLNPCQTGPGVWMINGSYQGNNNIYPVICSANALDHIGVPNNQDDAWLLYPGYGIKLYVAYNYSGTNSYIYYNTTTSPKIIGCNDWGGANTIIQSTSGGNYPRNNTESIIVYFRGQQIQPQSNLTG
jgi:hypothetical protein